MAFLSVAPRSLHRLLVFTLAAGVMSAVWLTGTTTAKADVTPPITVSGPGTYSSWTGDWTAIDDPEIACEEQVDHIRQNAPDAFREWAAVDLSVIPNGSVVHSVTVSVCVANFGTVLQVFPVVFVRNEVVIGDNFEEPSIPLLQPGAFGLFAWGMLSEPFTKQGGDQYQLGVEGFDPFSQLLVYSISMVADYTPPPGSLVVEKFSDPDGIPGSDDDEPIDWTVTVTGPAFPAGEDFNLVDGAVAIPSLAPGQYTVSEHSVADYTQTGASMNGSPLVEFGPSVTIEIGEESGNVRFFNQAGGSIRVEKTTLQSGTPIDERDGWAITVTGCGVDETQETDDDGIALFEDLPVCPGGYTVEEDASSKAGFIATTGDIRTGVGAVSESVAVVQFINERLCTNNCPTRTATAPASPTATPSPTGTGTPTTIASPTAVPTTPSPTATATSPASPTSTETGAMGGASPTPRPPATGSGAASASSSLMLILVIGGVLAVATGMTLSLSRRRW